VERPVASAAYSFVRFIGGGLAPYVAGRLVVAAGIHVPFAIATGVVVLGIVILSTAHSLLREAERVQAQQVTAAAEEPSASALIPVPADITTRRGRAGAGVIVAVIDSSPLAGRVTEAAGRLAAVHGRVVHVVHAQEDATAGDAGIDAEGLDAARAIVGRHLERLAARGVPAEGQVLLHAAGHGTAGRLVAEYANDAGAAAIVLGAPTHGALPALMDASASRELWRHARSNVLIINPAAPAPPSVAAPRETAHAG
jgi:MFS transporter, ACDE family, multidrug resistance protein